MGSKVGALKKAAQRCGMTPDQYLEKTQNGFKWCWRCRSWKLCSDFGRDMGRYDQLRPYCNRCARALYIQTHPLRLIPPRDGDKKQAHQLINQEVRSGVRPDPNNIPCYDCGHIWSTGDHSHHYDHYKGYLAEAHGVVQGVCIVCHHLRTMARGELSRDSLGRFRKS